MTKSEQANSVFQRDFATERKTTMMIFIWGQRLYGKCNKLPGVFYISTKFFHLWYLPLIPLESWLIFEGSEDGDGWQGCPVKMSAKSVLFGYLRPWLTILGIISAVFGYTRFNFDPNSALIYGTLGVAAITTAIASYFLLKPSQETLRSLMETAAFSNEDITALLEASDVETVDLSRIHGGGQSTSTGA